VPLDTRTRYGRQQQVLPAKYLLSLSFTARITLTTKINSVIVSTSSYVGLSTPRQIASKQVPVCHQTRRGWSSFSAYFSDAPKSDYRPIMPRARFEIPRTREEKKEKKRKRTRERERERETSGSPYDATRSVSSAESLSLSLSLSRSSPTLPRPRGFQNSKKFNHGIPRKTENHEREPRASRARAFTRERDVNV